MAKTIWTEPAVKDLEIIVKYIALDSPYYASIVGDKIVQTSKKLLQFPEIGRIVPEFNDHTIRELFCYSYRIIYKIKDDCFYILAIVHTSRDLLLNYKDRIEN